MKNKWTMKWFASMCCMVLLALSLVSCGLSAADFRQLQQLSPSQTRAYFDELLEYDFISSVTADTLTLHSSLRYPEEYGITDYEVSWGNMNVTFTQQDVDNNIAWIKQFRTLNRDHLTYEQQQSYDLYEYQLGKFRDSIDTYYYYDPFMGSGGYHAMMPMLLGEYDFFIARDVEDYLVLLGTLNELFDTLIRLEYERIDRGLFMTDAAVDDVIQSCNDFLSTTDDNILIRTFDKRVDALEGVGDDQKELWKAQNRRLFSDVVVPVYENLIAEMRSMKGSGTNDQGLAHYPYGKAYYTYRLHRMGIARSPEEIIHLAENTVRDYTAQFYAILRADPNALSGDPITPERTAEEIMDFLKEQCKGRFPELPDNVQYKLTVIDDTLKDFVPPAFYFVPRLDDYTNNSIYYNNDYFTIDRDYMFFVFAHEGYPGHLLQNVSLMSSDLSDWRKNTNFTAYSEGWATYVEYYAYDFLDVPAVTANIARLWDELYMLMMMRLDMGIHYEGWSKQDLVDYMNSGDVFLFNYPTDTLHSIYDFIVVNPMNSVPYVTGLFEVRSLAARYQNLLGDGYSDLLFHTEMLKYGEAPFGILQRWMDESLLGDQLAA